MCVDQRPRSGSSTLGSSPLHSLPIHSLPIHSSPLPSFPHHRALFTGSHPSLITYGTVEFFSPGVGIGLADWAGFGDTEPVPMGPGSWM